MDILTKLYNKGVSRRNFMAGAGALGAASMLAGCGDNGVIALTPDAPTDVDILNFALNLEYLEAEFFLRCATGSGLSTGDISGVGGAGAVTGGTQITGLTPLQQDFINELAYTEQQHVRFLRSALGNAAIGRPSIDLVNSFAAVAAAGGIPSSFSPYANFDSFLVGAFAFEDVGVTAYTGAAPLISPAGIAAGLLNYAAGIQAVEAYHAGTIRSTLTAHAIAGGSSYPYLEYANMVSNVRAFLGGGNETPLTLPSSGAVPSSIVQASPTTAVGYGRTFDEVLHIVYGTGGGAGVTKGGFFPAGVNGFINQTYS